MLRCPGSEVGWETTTELTDSSGFEFNTMRPRSHYALENLQLIERAVLTEEIRYVMKLHESYELYHKTTWLFFKCRNS